MRVTGHTRFFKLKKYVILLFITLCCNLSVSVKSHANFNKTLPELVGIYLDTKGICILSVMQEFPYNLLQMSVEADYDVIARIAAS